MNEQQEIRHEIENNNLQAVQDLLSYSPHLLKDRDALLFYAGQLGERTFIMQLLLDNGADIEGRTTSLGQTPLIGACASGKKDSIQFLVDHNADVDACATGTQKTIPLSAVCMNHEITLEQKLEIIDILLGRGANINGGSGQDCPLFVAINHSTIDLVKALISRGAPTTTANVHGSSVLHLACYRKSLAMIDLFCTPSLINKKDNEGNTALHLACRLESMEMIERLLMANPDLSGDLITGLPPAKGVKGAKGSIIIKQILDKMAEIPPHLLPKATSLVLTPLVFAILESRHQPDLEAQFQGHTALYYACEKCNDTLVEALLKKGANPNNLSERIPPMYLSFYENKYKRVFDLLLEYNSNVNISTTRNTAQGTVKKFLIHSVMETNNTYYLNKLLKAGVMLEDYVETSNGKEMRQSIWKFAKYNCLPEIHECLSWFPHSAATHRCFPANFRRAVVIFMMANKREKWRLDNALIHKIFSYGWD